MDSGGEKDGESSDASGIGSTTSLHDHSDLLIPNPSFLSSPASVSSTASSSMMITSPINATSEHHELLENLRHMDSQMTSQESLPSYEGGDFAISLEQPQRQPDSSPPNVVVDDSPLQPCMDRNKQSLKVKLLMRRPMNQLVEQGILPPPKTPAAFAGQRVRLERARMGDLLKAKIQQRPARQELIRQHILEDTDSRVAPSLAEKQRMLKRARLADSLSDHLIHRPGPLELVQKNILHAPDENIDKAIKDGIVSFKATCEGHVPGPSLPNKYTCNEDDSSSDISSPAGTPDASSSGHTTEANTPLTKEHSDPAITSVPVTTLNTTCLPVSTAVASTVSISLTDPCEVTLQPAKTNKSETITTTPTAQTQLILATPATISSSSLAQPKITPGTIFQVTTTAPATVIPPPPPLPPPQTIVLSDGAVRELLPQLQSAGFQLAAAVQKPQSSLSSSSTLGKSRSSKKSSKSKSQPKARTIKFHEYKGPSSCGQKGSAGGNTPISSSSASAQSTAESSYELLLKQQQLFLQWQLEWQHKYPQILLPAAPKITPGSPQSTSTGATTGSISIGNGKATMSSFPVTTINLLNQQLPSSSQQANASNINSNPKLISTPITLAPKIPTEIAPKPAEASSIETKTCETAPSSPEKSTFRSISLNNISDWKVNDLKAELKKRSLPVSGSKIQLVERLKVAAAKDSVVDKKSPAPVTVKMEVVGGQDESSSEAMMEDESGSGNKSISAPTTPCTPGTAVVIGTPPPTNVENNNISILDLNGAPISLQNILSLLGVSTFNTGEGGTIIVNNNNNPSSENNFKNATGTSNLVQAAATSTARVISQLPISTVVATAAKAVAAAASTSTSSSGKFVDENKILEQQKQILELQKQLEISQQELQKLSQHKDLNSQQGGPQKHHRLVLQQHIQQKQRQQAIQNQLQNLIQLQNQKQAEQKKQQQLLQQQQQQQQQHQAQIVVINNNASPGGSQGVSTSNNMLPVAIVNNSQPPTPEQQISLGSHQWLRDQSQHEEETSDSINFEDLVDNIDAKDIPKLEQENSGAILKKSVKSQMVDDVLEILIRNGELPPSAAQDPHPKTSLLSSSTGSGANSDNSQRPPPPPPLPPPTFSVMLPTTIPFSRHHPTSTSDFLTFGGLGARTEENLSKDAQEILRISEDLKNFGKSREAEAAAAAAAAIVASVKIDNINSNTNGTSSMDCGFFADNKDYDLSVSGTTTTDSMDVGFADSHSLPLRSNNSSSKQFQNSSPFDSGFSFGQPHHQQHTSLKSDGHDPHQNHFMSDDELLPLPVALDMQMDTDYSDWLDTLLPESSGNSGTTPSTTNHISTNSPSNNQFHHQVQHQNSHHSEVDAIKSGTMKQQQQAIFNHNNNNSQNSINGVIFGSLLNNVHQLSADQDHHNLTSRDPLLSSTRGFCSSGRVSSVPFGESIQQQHNNFLFAQQHHNNIHNNHSNSLFFGNPSSVGSTSSATTLMDTDFDELTTACTNLVATKKSENNIICASNNLITEMPSTTTITLPSVNQTPITTSSMNDNYLWDFPM